MTRPSVIYVVVHPSVAKSSTDLVLPNSVSASAQSLYMRLPRSDPRVVTFSRSMPGVGTMDAYITYDRPSTRAGLSYTRRSEPS